ncbi:hypothetical protein CRE_14349 [Caenorhabditis remanei]|uniref:F-box domain-containing protein n=1 Tax=Caenorhabditis remanei TaxID=31234 RepID=E3NIP3_CAERE|nr:hypothetical protein CRE_14349 [Caenorhabditis remanei]
MADSLINNPIALRGCILYDVLRGKSMKESYSDLCDAIGDVKFANFKYWFNRFSDGNFDLDFDRSSQESKTPEFSDFPENVIRIIGEKLDLKEQLILRKVCKRFRKIVDEQVTLTHHSLGVICQDGHIFCEFNHRSFVYAAEKWIQPGYDDRCRNSKIIRTNDYVNIACSDMKFILNNSKLDLKLLEYGYIDTENTEEESEIVRTNYEAVKSTFDSLNRKISTKNCMMETTELDVILDILPHLKPGTLERIEVDRADRYDNWDEDQWEEKIYIITSLEQWKQAVEIYTRCAFDYFEAEHFFHVKTLEIFEYSEISREALQIVRDLASKHSLTSCEFLSDMGFEIEELEAAGNLSEFKLSESGLKKHDEDVIYHYPIPNSTDYLEYHYTGDFIVTRRSRLDGRYIESVSKTFGFSNLSDDLIAKIFEKLDLKKQLTLRKVCKRFRNVADEKCIHSIKSIVISCLNSRIYCRFNGHEVVYSAKKWTKPNDDVQCQNAKIIRGNGYRNIACNDLNYVLSNPNLQLEYFEFEYKKLLFTEGSTTVKTNYKAVKSFLESFSHKISVKKCKISTTDLIVILDVLPFLQSKTLKRIEICRAEGLHDTWDDSPYRKKIDKLAELEQWKQAEELYAVHSFKYFQHRHLSHFKHLDVYENSIDIWSISAVFQMFSTKSFRVSQCHYYVRNGINIAELNAEGAIIGDPAPRHGRDGMVRHCSIPNSTDYLEFHYRPYWGDMIVTRKSDTDN